MGAPEILFSSPDGAIRKKSDTYAKDGLRVLALTSAKGTVSAKSLPGKLVPHALIVLEEKVRSDAAETLLGISRNKELN